MVDDPRDDAGLVEAARAGDRQAFAAIFDRYAPRVHDFCTRRLNEPHTAADATQDTFIAAAGKLDQLRDPTRLRPWLYAIARNECTRHGRVRAKAVPIEDVAMTAAREDAQLVAGDATAEAVAAGEVGDLLWSAAAGLDEKDRDLLELHVRHGLEGAELAEAAGVASGQISMATGRMRDRLERAIGALLVARGGRDDCPALGVVLADWDGTFSVLMRKRVARHIDSCDRCGERQRALVAPLGSLALAPLGLTFVLPEGALEGVRQRVLEAFDSSATGGQPPDAAGPGAGDPTDRGGVEGAASPTPPAIDGAHLRRRRRLLGAAAVLVLLLGGGLLLALDRAKGSPGSDSSGELTLVEAGPAGEEADRSEGTAARDGSTSTSSDEATTTARPSTTGGEATTTTAARSASTTVVPAPGPTSPAPPVTIAPAPAPPNQAPSVGSTSLSSPGPMQLACNPANATRTVSVTITDDRGVASAVLRWSGANVGQAAMTKVGASTWRATLGPFANAGSVAYRAVATDADGASAASPTASISVEPCPG